MEGTYDFLSGRAHGHYLVYSLVQVQVHPRIAVLKSLIMSGTTECFINLDGGASNRAPSYALEGVLIRKVSKCRFYSSYLELLTNFLEGVLA